MRKNAWYVIGLSVAFSISAMAEVVILDEDFSSSSIANTDILRDSSGGWYTKALPSNWAIADGALTGTGQLNTGEGACGQVIPVDGLGLNGENILTLTFDYATTHEGETVYVHIWGCKENDIPSASTTGIMNPGAQNGNIWDATYAPFDLYNLGKSNGVFTGSIGIASDAAVSGLTGSGSYTNTFDLSTFTSAPATLDQYDYIAVGLARDQANAEGLTTFDNIKLVADKVSVVASAIINPEVLVMDMVSPSTVATGTVDFIYNSDANLDVTITISDQSHLGAFTVVSDTPQTLINKTTELVFEIDNAIAGLVNGDTATGLVTFAWVEVGGAYSGQITMPISSMYGFAPGQTNLFTGAVDSEWSDAANWDLSRIPGALGADLALIDGVSVNVVSNFTGLYAWDTVVQGASSMNIAADLAGSSNMTVGSSEGYGYVNQSAGSHVLETLSIGDAATVSNSVYTLSGGSLTTTGPMYINAGGVMKVTGGSMTVATESSATGLATWLTDGAVLEISGGTYLDTSRLSVSADSSIRIVGDDADITFRQLYGYFLGSVDFVLDETGVSTLKNSSWGALGTITFNIDGAAYTGGPQEILLYTGIPSSPLGSYAVTNMGVEGVDWEIIDATNTSYTVTLKIIGTSYETWAAGYGLYNDDPAEDYDADGLNNLYEYGLGGNPTNAADIGHVPTYNAVDEGGITYFEYVYARRLDPDSGLDYTAEFGTSLINTNWSTSEVVVSPETGTIDDDFEAVTNRVDTTGKPRGFMQLLIESL
jgi:hypothetical protein